MTGKGANRPFSTLQRFARQAPATRSAQEYCDMCGEPVPSGHRHLLDLSSRGIVCACQACSLLFDKNGAGAGKFKLVSDRRLHLEDFEMTDAQWEGLLIPVNMAFFFHSSEAGRVVALYPGPAGPTESLLELATWKEMEEHSPVLKDMEPDVEAVLVNRVRGAREHFLVPIDECYKLVGLMRLNWRGLSGGNEVWVEIARFFEELRGRAKSVRSGESGA